MANGKSNTGLKLGGAGLSLVTLLGGGFELNKFLAERDKRVQFEYEVRSKIMQRLQTVEEHVCDLDEKTLYWQGGCINKEVFNVGGLNTFTPTGTSEESE